MNTRAFYILSDVTPEALSVLGVHLGMRGVHKVFRMINLIVGIPMILYSIICLPTVSINYRPCTNILQNDR